MWEWLLTPIDPARSHEVSVAVAWHARSMVLGWGVVAPLAIIIARFFKILPGQDWPRELDTQVWWRSHWIGQMFVLGLSALGLVLVLPSDPARMSLHNWCGYAVLAGLALQMLLGIFRGSKGGPTAPGVDGSLRGHHYDMTWRRRVFETVHKSVGYGVVFLAFATILLGLWKANAPIWMWLALLVWWPFLIAVFVTLQRRGLAVDTYQAIWGTDHAHPGNRLPKPGWGVRRLGNIPEHEGDSTQDRRSRAQIP